MKTAGFWAVAGAYTAMVLAGLFWLAPVTHGQAAVTSRQWEPQHVIVATGDTEPQVVRGLEVLSGRGSAIGVTVRDLDQADVNDKKVATARGAIIEEVGEGSPAEKAGIKPQDVVTSFDGESVRSARQFSRLVDETPVGRSVKIGLLRQGAKLDLDVTPAADAGLMRLGRRLPRDGQRFALPEFPALPDFREFNFQPELNRAWEGAMGRGALGVEVEGLTPDLGEYFGAKNGVLVASVRPDSPAAKAGIKAGDVITSVNGKTVNDAAELRRQVRAQATGDLSLEIVRDKKPLSLKATIPAPETPAQPRRKWPV